MSGNKQQQPDASHCCHNRRCVNPAHVVFEGRKLNLRRCRNGDAFYCKCGIQRCIYVLNGRWLPCRNNPDNRDRTCDEGCEQRCFGKLFFATFLVFICCQFADHALNLVDTDDEFDDADDQANAEQSDDEALDSALNDDDQDLDSQTEDEAPSPKRARGGKN